MSVTQAQYFFTVYVNVKISKERRAQSYGNHSKSFLVFFQCIQLGNPNPLSRSWKLACFKTFPHAPSSVILISNVTPRGSGLHHMEEGPFSDSKESACNAGDPGSIPVSGRCPGEGNGNPLQYSCLENSMDRGAWQATVHGVANCWDTIEQLTLSPFHYRGLSVSSNSFSASVKLFV